MAAVVLGSVLIYSFFLPQAAPKQITLAVLPFSENGEFTPLSVGFSAALRDSIALSRDVAIVDTVSTNSVMWNPDRASGVSHILAITHFVDGELHSVEGTLRRVDYRVVNVSQPNWKEVLNVEGVDFHDSHTVQNQRDEMTLQVRGALYDNSSLRTEPVQQGTSEYREYLISIGEWLLQHKDSDLLSSLHEAFQAHMKDLFEESGIATHPNRELWEAVATFEETQDTVDYSKTVWRLAGEFPNSLAVETLGSLAYDLQKLRLAEFVWLRVARLQPQSAFVALNIAHIRRLLGDSEGTVQAFRIAELRDDLGIVNYFRALDEYRAKDIQHFIVEGFDSTLLDELRDSSGGLVRGEFLISASIHTGSLASYRPNDIETAKLWRAAPFWLRDDDPRWKESRDFLAKHFPSASAAAPTDLLSRADEADALTELFAPRRPE